MNKKIVLIWLIVGVSLVIGCIEKEDINPTQVNFKPSVPMDVNLSISGVPSLNQVVKLRLVVSPLVDAPNTTIQILLPEGFELISGDLEWKGNIPKGESIQLSAEIKAVKTGEWEIKAVADSEAFGKVDRLFVLVTEDPETSKVSESSNRATKVSPLASATPVNSTLNVSSKTAIKSAEVSSLGSGQIVVYGYFGYYDKNNNFHAIEGAIVELYDSEPWGAEGPLATTTTDEYGYYEFPPIDNNDGWLEDGRDVFVRYYAKASGKVKVTIDGSGIFYGETDVESDVPDGYVYMGVWAVTDSEKRAAWYIADRITEGHDFIEELGYDLPEVTVKWAPGSIDGTYYRLGEWIHLKDGDQWDSDVILHEYGHFIMYQVYDSYPPTPNCGSHWWASPSSQGCAWSEGWANFIQGVIQDDEYYIDTDDQWLKLNLEIPTQGWGYRNGQWVFLGDDYYYISGDDVEGAVAGALWDIFDSNNEEKDSLSEDINPIWSIIKRYNPNTIMDFWNNWLDEYDSLKALNAIFYQNGIDYNNPPTCRITSPNGGGWYSGTITVSALASDSDGSVSQVEFQYSLDGVNWHDIGKDTNPSDGWSVSWNTGTITDSTVWVRARAKDNLGEYSSWDTSDSSFGVDNSPPSKPSPDDGISGWTRNNDPTFTWSPVSDVGSGIAGYYYELDDSTPDYWTTSTSVSFTNIPDGIHTFYVRAKDKAGNLGEIGSHVIKIDTTPPQTKITSGPSGIINYDDVTFKWSGNDNLVSTNQLLYSYKLEGYDSSWSPWTTSTSKTYYNLPEGSYTFKVRTKDLAGNIDPTPAERSFTIKLNQPPNIPSKPFGPTSGYVDENYTYTTSTTDPDGDNVKFIFSWGDGSTSETGYVSSGTTVSRSHSWSNPGTYCIKVKAVDEHSAESGWSGCLYVTIEEKPQSPQLCTNPDPPSHDFGEMNPGETDTWTFMITNCGGGTLEWTISDDQSWISVSPTSGTTTTETDTVTVTVDTTGLNPGTYTGHIYINSNGGSKTGTISVTVQPIPVVGFDSAQYLVNENDSLTVITVVLSNATGQIVTVDYSTSDGTATTGVDYQSTYGTIVFNPGETIKTFTVPIIDDKDSEGNETIILHLSNPANATLGLDTATLTIIDDDGPSAQEWTVSIDVVSGTYIQPLEFGTNVSATDGFDPNIDEAAPPLPPDTTKYAYFRIEDPIFNKLSKDYRSPINQSNPTETWTLAVSSDEQISLSWDTSNVPDNITLNMNVNGNIINMKDRQNLTLDAGEYTLQISAGIFVTINIQLKRGWNLISLPVIPVDLGIPSTVTRYAYWYNPETKNYEPVDINNLQPKKGYWVAAISDCNITVTGTQLREFSTSLKRGWNMIGSLIISVNIHNIQTDPENSIVSRAYWFDPTTKRYVASETLEPCKGYWIAAINNCNATISSF